MMATLILWKINGLINVSTPDDGEDESVIC